MKKGLLMILVVAILLMSAGCSNTEADQPIAEADVQESTDAESTVETENEAETEVDEKAGFEDCDTALTNMLNAELNRDYEIAESYFWRESLDSILPEGTRMYKEDSYSEYYELLSFQITDSKEISNEFDLDVMNYEVQWEIKSGENIQSSQQNIVMVFVPGEGWRRSHLGYLSSTDLEFDSAQVGYNQEVGNDEDLYVSKRIIFAPKKFIYTVDTTLMAYETICDFTAIGDVQFVASPSFELSVDTKILLDDGNNVYSYVMPPGELANVRTFRNDGVIQKYPVENPKNIRGFIDLGQNVNTSYIPKSITIEDYVVKYENEYSLYDVVVMKNGEFLSEQQSTLKDTFKYE